MPSTVVASVKSRTGNGTSGGAANLGKRSTNFWCKRDTKLKCPMDIGPTRLRGDQVAVASNGSGLGTPYYFNKLTS